MPVITSFEEQEEQFIATGIELGLTFADVARTEYLLGETQGGAMAQARAVRTCSDVERRLDAAEARGRPLGKFRDELHLLYKALESLSWYNRRVA